jgi:hypothetical protein
MQTQTIFQRYALSSLTTFLTVAVSTLSAQLAVAGTIQWTGDFWLAILVVVLRAAFKAVVEGLAAKNADAPTY